MKPMQILGAVMAISLASLAGQTAADTHNDPQKPNFVLIMIDDAAFMDLGITGGEAKTPNIDALAQRGALFTQYRSSPLCAPSRAMLLTGVDNHRTGVATIWEVLPDAHQGQPGYTMSLEPGVMTIAERLKPLGYTTLMTGKWHLGHGAGALPVDQGFDRSFALDASGADNWEDKSYAPLYEDAPWYEDGKEADLPEDFYSSTFIVEKMLDYLKDSPADKPFLAYLAFQAIHIPVQAPAEFTANYKGVYDEGWAVLQQRRWAKAKELGFIPIDAPLPALHPSLRDWDSLTQDQKRLFAARMEVNAGMLEAMDYEIGRFIDHLKSIGAYENTVFVVTSDNGPEPNDADDPRFAPWLWLNDYHAGLENIGEKGSYGFIGPEFASAAAGPGHLFKFYTTEGGLHVPMIMAGPGVDATGSLSSRTLVTDIVPTLLEMAGAPDAPADSVSIDGRSLMPLLRGQADEIYGPDDSIGFEVSGNAALYKGDYKLARNMTPWGDGQWHLYDITRDPGETNNLATAMPEKLAELQAEYAEYAARMGVLEVPEGYDSFMIVQKRIQALMLERHWGKLLLASLLLLGITFFLMRVIFRLIFRRAA